MSPGGEKKFAGLISFLIYLGIFIMSSLPGSALPAKIPDIIPHFCEYAILSFFFIQTFNNPTAKKTMAISFAWLLLLSFLDELHQTLVPGRFFALADLGYDAMGIVSGLTAYAMLHRGAAGSRASQRRKMDQE